jgi:hypothetical protein
MKSYLFIITTLVLLASCKEETTNNLIVNGKIEGLRVGTIFLQKIQDSALVSLDSVAINGTSEFSLSTNIEEPQILYLYLDVKDGSKYDDRLSFFAKDTIMSINSSLSNFERDAVITGSKNQDVLSVFNKNLGQLNKTYLELMKRSVLLQQEDNPSPVAIQELDADYEKYLRKKIIYALNYAAVNIKTEVAPYILLQEGFDANPKLLDSIYNLMPKKIQTSLFGKKLSELIKELKEN